jgi:hypothetical protein
VYQDENKAIMHKTISSLLVLITISTVASAQTHSIAHKSHSGPSSTIDRTSPERFGAIESPPLLKIERIENEHDTATILYFGYSLGNTETYRVEHHPIFNAEDVNVDSLQKVYAGSVELIGFEKAVEPLPIESEGKKKKAKKKQWLAPFRLSTKGPISGILLLMFCSVALLVASKTWKVSLH